MSEVLDEVWWSLRNGPSHDKLPPGIRCKAGAMSFHLPMNTQARGPSPEGDTWVADLQRFKPGDQVIILGEYEWKAVIE